MPYYAQLSSDNVVIAVTQTSGPLPPSQQLVEIEELRGELCGQRYDAAKGKFEPVESTAPAPAWEWLIDIGPFFDRYGAAKMAVLTSADAGVQAILKDTQIRKWLDLKLPEMAQSVAYVGTKVPAVTVELQAAILTTPVAPSENLALRKLYFS